MMPLLLWAGGCESSRHNDPMAGTFYLDPQKDLHQLGRVTLAELENLSEYPEISASATDALFLHLQKKHIFSLVIVHRNDPVWPALQEGLESLHAMRVLVDTREMLNCDGLLVGTVTEYRPYPHPVLGLRLKMLDLTDGRLLWGFEQVWDSADRDVQRRIRDYLKTEVHSGTVPLSEELVSVSPREFARFAAHEVAGTLTGQENRSNAVHPRGK